MSIKRDINTTIDVLLHTNNKNALYFLVDIVDQLSERQLDELCKKDLGMDSRMYLCGRKMTETQIADLHKGHPSTAMRLKVFKNKKLPLRIKKVYLTQDLMDDIIHCSDGNINSDLNINNLRTTIPKDILEVIENNLTVRDIIQ